jgi:hypothetical protein
MLLVPEYLLFTSDERKKSRIKLSVKFDNPIAKMPDRYIERDLLNQMIRAFSKGTLRFISFDEHAKRIEAIKYVNAHHSVITVKSVDPSDFPKDWQSVSIEDGDAQPESLAQFAAFSEDGSRLRVGTMSSEIYLNEMRLERNAASVNAIMDALEAYQPDVLLTAGYSLNNETDLALLEDRLKASRWDGLLFIEVKHYESDLPRVTDGDLSLSSHCLFAWTCASGWKRMGRQYFATSDQARASLDTLVAAFERNLPQRVIEFRGRRFGGLICGEINALQGRNNVSALTPKIESWLRSLDVIVNPTHDLMGNAGTVIAKRKWVSQGGRSYLSASNWNTGKPRKQKRTSRTLHTVFIDGCEVVQSPDPRQHENYEYREAYIR